MSRPAISSLALAAISGWVLSSDAHAQNHARQESYQKVLQEKLDAKLGEMMEVYGEKISKAERWTCEVRMQESADYAGKVDSEISVTMPIDEFKEFAPIALLEAVAVPHNFPTGTIFIRETTTRRVASIDYRAADPLSGKYLTGRPKAVEDAIAEMTQAMTWH
jgi:hypothetical protein